jgi:hypothetical protein
MMMFLFAPPPRYRIGDRYTNVAQVVIANRLNTAARTATQSNDTVLPTTLSIRRRPLAHPAFGRGRAARHGGAAAQTFIMHPLGSLGKNEQWFSKVKT